MKENYKNYSGECKLNVQDYERPKMVSDVGFKNLNILGDRKARNRRSLTQVKSE